MNIVQSAWACGKTNLLEHKAGWLSAEYNLMSMCLSCLQLKKYYNNVILYSDDIYAKVLIDILQLPFTDVKCELNYLNRYHEQLWALPKIYTYSKQEAPFIHIDGDIFVWEKFTERFLQSELLAQNFEKSTEYYEGIMLTLEKNLTYFPPEIIEHRNSKELIFAYNAGLFGGSDMDFFREYCMKAFEFVNKNLNNLHKINVTNFNMFFEQYLFYCLITKQNKKISVLLDTTYFDNGYKGLAYFIDVPYKQKYIHVLGTYKHSQITCLQMADRLRQDYPEYYYKVIEYAKKGGATLFRDYYYFLNSVNSNFLLERYNKLIEIEEEDVEKYFHNEEITYPIQVEKIINRSFWNTLIFSQREDLKNLCGEINLLVNNQFKKISPHWLYKRDISLNLYYQYLFEDESTIDSKYLQAYPSTKIVETKFAWFTLFNREIINKKENNKILTHCKYLVAIVPECNKWGFSIARIDMLDKQILHVLKTKLSIKELLERLKKYFDDEDYKKSKKEYKQLIFNRIKYAISTKTIKIIL